MIEMVLGGGCQHLGWACLGLRLASGLPWKQTSDHAIEEESRKRHFPEHYLRENPGYNAARKDLARQGPPKNMGSVKEEPATRSILHALVEVP